MSVKRQDHAGENPDQQRILNLIRVNNRIYTLNTFVRPFGGLIHDAMLRGLLHSGRIGMTGYLNIEFGRSVSHMVGFVYGYYRTGITNDFSQVTATWINACLLSSLCLLMIERGLFGSISFYALLGVSFFYKFYQGYRDAVRPGLYRNLAANLNSDMKFVSDAHKNQMRNRKMFTTVAEMLGNWALALFLSTTGSSNFFLPIVCCVLANAVCLVVLKRTDSIRVTDPRMTTKQAQDFSQKLLPQFFYNMPKNVGTGTASTFRVLQNVFNLEGSLRSGYLNKFNLFSSAMILSKLFTGISKAQLFLLSSHYPQYSPAKEGAVKGISTWLVLLSDMLATNYRSRYGRQPFSSLQGISASLVLFELTNLGIFLTTTRANANYSMFGSYPALIMSNSMMIPAFTHLFEVWGQEAADSNPLFESFRNNLTSIIASNLSRPFVGLMMRWGIYFPVQLVVLACVIRITSCLQNFATEAEKI